MIIDNKFELGEILYLKTDAEQHCRICTAIIVSPDNSYLYELTCGIQASKHYDFEITPEKLYSNA
jgi:hypothetical protein